MLASLLQVLSTGLGLAGYYALVAVGFALIFATLRIFHVAHGTVFVIAGYTFFGLHRLLEDRRLPQRCGRRGQRCARRACDRQDRL